MKIYLFYINGIAGLEDWMDRELVFAVFKLTEEEGKMTLSVEVEDTKDLRKLHPGRNYALQFEVPGSKELKYYNMSAFEVIPQGHINYDVVMYVTGLTV